MIDIHLNESYEKMLEGKQGPVWLDVPLDIQSKYIDVKDVKKFKSKNKKLRKGLFFGVLIIEICKINLLKSF